MKMHPQLALAGAAVLMLLVLVCSFAQVDLDLFHLLSIGREITRTGSVPMVDSASYLPTLQPVVHHEWLSGLIFYNRVQAGGGTGFVLLRWLLIALLAALAIVAARKRGATPELLILLAPVAIMLVGPALTLIRAQVFTTLLVAAFLVLLHANRWRAMVIALVLHVAWLNLHAGFVVGCGLVLLHVIETALRERRAHWPWIVFLLAAPLLVFINPYGTPYFSYLAISLFMPRPDITEWSSIWHADAYIIGAFVLSLALAAYAFVRATPRRTNGICMLCVTAVFTMWHQRHGGIYGVVWLALVPAWLSETPLRTHAEALLKRRALVSAASTAVVLVALALAVREKPWQLRMPVAPAAEGETRPRIIFPQGAVDYIRNTKFEGPVLAPFETAAYVSWRLGPGVKTAIDSRYEVAFDVDIAQSFIDLYHVRGRWEETLATYPPELILTPTSSKLAAALSSRGEWRTVYRDDAYLLYARANDQRWLYVDARGQRPIPVFP